MQNKSDSNIDLKEQIDDLKKDLSDYVEKRAELFKLTSYEKLAQSGSFIAYSLMVLFLVFNIFFLVMLGLAYYVGDHIKNVALGFGILIVISTIVLVVFTMLAKPFRRYIVNKIISILQKIERNEE